MDSAGLALADLRLSNKLRTGLTGSPGAPINIIRARSPSGTSSIPSISGTVPSEVKANPGASSLSLGFLTM